MAALHRLRACRSPRGARVRALFSLDARRGMFSSLAPAAAQPTEVMDGRRSELLQRTFLDYMPHSAFLKNPLVLERAKACVCDDTMPPSARSLCTRPRAFRGWRRFQPTADAFSETTAAHLGRHRHASPLPSWRPTNHPCALHPSKPPRQSKSCAPSFVRGPPQGLYYWDVAGKRYFDGIGGIFTVSVGHGHPAVTGAVKRQLDAMTFAPPMHGVAGRS